MTDEQRELREAYGYATRFLQAFCENNGLRQVEPLPTLCGVLTQIDNATTAPRARVAKLEAALKGARPYVQGLYDAVKYGDGHIPKLVLDAIDDALKDAPQ